MREEAWDKIHIRNLEVFGKHGVFPEENRLGQLKGMLCHKRCDKMRDFSIMY